MVCIHNTQTMVTLLQVNREMEKIVRPRLFQYLLEHGLYEIISTGDLINMKPWKKRVFDAFPPGHPTRSIIIHALFFLLGGQDFIIQRWTYAYPALVTTDFVYVWKIGWIFRPFSYQLAKVAGIANCNINKIRAAVKQNAIFQSPLFGKMVQISDFPNAVETRIKVVGEVLKL